MADPMKGEEKPPAANFATTTSSTTAATNFEYDNETEWDVGIGDLIIDLDADIEKTTTTPAPSSSTILPPPSISSPLKPLSSSLPLGKQLSHHPHLGTSAGPASTIMAVEHSATVDKGLKMKIKRTQKPSGNKQHEIVKSGGSGASGSTMGSSASVGNSSSGSVENGSDSQSGASSNTGSGSNSQNKKQSGGMASGSGSGTSVTSHRKGDKKSSLSSSSSSSTPAPPTSTPLPSPHCDKTGDLLLGGPNAPGPPAPPAGVAPGTSLINSIHSTTGNLHNSSSSVVTSSASGLSDLHDIRHKIKTEQKETADVCIGTSVGTITEPECLGPCEPGTSVTLEGIVWHETEGVLVVNVTWRGKTYVGTLLDCTRHDWAPPRFCDSPTSDLDSRTTKNSSGTGGGRTSKRGRNLNSGSGGGSSSSGGVAGSLGGSGGNGLGFGDLSNFTETRSSKLRNNSGSSSGGKDGRDGNSSNGNGNGGSSGKDAKSQRRTTNNSNSSGVIADKAGNSGGTSSPTPFVLPRPDKRKASKDDSKEGGNTNSSNASSNSSSDSKKSRSSAPPASPPGSGPVLLECPDPNCSKKYKHINGLRYHQSHAHGGVGSTETETENPASETETETHEGEEGRLQTFPSTLVDGTSEHVMRLPGETSGGVPPAVPPSPSASTPSSTPSTNSTPCNSSVSNSTSSVQGAPSGFKIKSPASLLTDVHSMADPNVPDTKSGPGGVAMTTGVDLSSSPSPHNKKKRKHDETLPLSATSGPVSTGGSAPVLDSPTPNSSTPGAPGPPSAIHPGREEPTSPAYSDISDDETRPGRYPNNEPMAAYYPPGTLQTGPGPVGPPVPPGSGLGPASNPGVEKIDSKGPGPNEPPGPNSAAGPGPGSMGGIYYPYPFAPGYPYSNVPPQGSPLGPPHPNPNAPPGTDPRHPGPLNPPDDKSSLNSPHGKLQPGPAGPGSDKGGGSGNENHQILKESHEVKNQVLLPGTYGGRQPNAPPPDSRFYLYNTPGQEAAAASAGAGGARQRKESHSAPGSGGKPSLKDIKKETEDSKDQGVKPTMETQGPPPAPTSQQYAYIHAGYLPGPPYNAYEPSHPGNPHPMYRGGLGGHLPGVLPGHLLPYQLHPHARYPPTHVPEDLSTPNSDTQKNLDMYYQTASTHKIHELQERAIKSPSTPSSNSKPSSQGPLVSTPPSHPQSPASAHPGGPSDRSGPNPSPGGPPGPNPPGPPASGGKEGRRSSSPPPQRHVHTHHHTHVGLGYSILASQYPPPYGGAAVQAVINQYPPTTK